MTDTKRRIVGIGGTFHPDSRNLLALKSALAAAEQAGAEVRLFDLSQLNLPMYNPHKPLEQYDTTVRAYIKAIRGADALLWSTSAYHGTMAGITKNAIDYLQLLAHDPNPYLHEKVVGLIAIADGTMAGANTLNAMVHSVHALRGLVVPLMVAIPNAGEVIRNDGVIIDTMWGERLEKLGKMVVSFARKLHSDVSVASL